VSLCVTRVHASETISACTVDFIRIGLCRHGFLYCRQYYHTIKHTADSTITPSSILQTVLSHRQAYCRQYYHTVKQSALVILVLLLYFTHRQASFYVIFTLFSAKYFCCLKVIIRLTFLTYKTVTSQGLHFEALFAKLRKATISFSLSVPPTGRPNNTTPFTLDEFS
jgi:hypothetical protein